MSRRSQLEVFRCTIAHEPHDDFLFYADFTPALLESLCNYTGLWDADSIAERYGMYKPVFVMPEAPVDSQAPDFSNYYKDIDIPEGSSIDGIGVLHIPGSMYHFTRFISPLRNVQTLDDVKDFPFVSFDGFQTGHMASSVVEAHSNGLVALGAIGHLYEDAWQIRGYEEFLMDMLAGPEICELILDCIAANVEQRAVAAAKAGVDVIISGDDVANQKAMMFDASIWRKFIKQRWARIYAAARSIKPDIEIWYHSDGNISDIVPELIDIGITILNPVQPECVDLVMLKREYGKHLVFDGTIGTQTTMPFGTADEVRQVVRERKKSLGDDGALILSPTHILEPKVPVENVIAFFEAASEPY